MQQQSGAVEFVQKTGGRTLKEHLKKKKDRKTGGKKWRLHRKTCNCEENHPKECYSEYTLKSTALPPTHSRKCRV